MSQLTADHAHDVPPAPHVAARQRLREEEISPPGNRTLGFGMMLVGAVALIVLLLAWVGGEKPTVALAAYHAGVVYITSLAVGCMGLVMILQQFNAGWSAVLRRQIENIAWLMPLCFFAFLIILAFAPSLFHWMNVDAEHDTVLGAKAEFLNKPFWYIRAITYFAIWTGLSWAMYYFSKRQDETGDVWLTARARKISSWGILLFALTSAFAAFDWLMSLDYAFFSTMFGVYFFAGSIISTVALIILVFGVLRLSGKLTHVVTEEHFHDLGKLLLSFTVFWAYITFSQYFLIWYSNIPEETWWYNLRQENGWQSVFLLLCLGHFALPFLVLLFRNTKRRIPLLMAVAAWILVMHGVDLFWIVMPSALYHDQSAPAMSSVLLPGALGIGGVALVFFGAVFLKITSGPLVPLKDPRLHESLAHKNYV